MQTVTRRGFIIFIPFLIANLAPIVLPSICPNAIVNPISQLMAPNYREIHKSTNI